jgi:hypothetical protein
MPIQNTESTLAAALGVSGTLSPRKGLFPITPLTMIWRRQFEPADALLSAVTTQGGIALAERTIALEEGQWVTLDTSGKAVVADSGSGGASTGLAWPVWSGGDRLDPKGGVTVLHGKWVAHTSYFDDGGVYAVGTLLKVAAGAVTVQGVAGKTGALTPVSGITAAELAKVVAVVERTAFGTSTDTPSGIMQIRSV